MREHARPGKQDSDERAAGVVQPRAAESAEPVSALLALQRAAGNAAVTAALRTQGHDHGAGQVQRVPVGAHVPTVVQRVPQGQQASGEHLSARVLRRLHVANDAIRQIQADTRHAANQQSALVQTLYNSSLRAIVQQHNGFWDLSRLPSGTNRAELAAAKALYARSMICETSAECTFSYLRRWAVGEDLMMILHPRQMHWFVIIGAEDGDPSEWVVADPWPTQARAVEWEDHFCYSPGLENVFVHKKMRADGNDTARHLAHQIDLNNAGWYVARWDLNKLDGRSIQEIGQMLQRAGVGINLHQDDLAEQIMQGLADVDDWPTNDIGTWPIDQLDVWCLAQIDAPIVRRLLARPESTGNHRDLREEIAGGIGEVRQQGDNSWIWDVRHSHAQG